MIKVCTNYDMDLAKMELIFGIGDKGFYVYIPPTETTEDFWRIWARNLETSLNDLIFLSKTANTLKNALQPHTEVLPPSGYPYT